MGSSVFGSSSGVTYIVQAHLALWRVSSVGFDGLCPTPQAVRECLLVCKQDVSMVTKLLPRFVQSKIRVAATSVEEPAKQKDWFRNEGASKTGFTTCWQLSCA